MSYIGNVPTTAAFPFDQFSGNGSTTVFTLSNAPAGTTSILVTISGVTQNPNVYSVAATTLTFNTAPAVGTNNIAVLYLGLPAIVASPVPISNGGTGQTTRQNAMDALAGSTTSGYYLRGDGTDVVMAAIVAGDVPTLNQNTSGTAAGLSATLAVASGGTGVTSSTGTGSVVLSTSPTLTTPALGTPSALVGTNITGTATAFTASNVTTNANLTGAVTSTGNATSLGSFTSAQLLGALSDETGTGSAVFATSPTLVTPILGTPTSGNLANCTFPTLNQNTTGTASNVTGTVAVANGGTGSTTLTLNNVVLGNGTSAVQLVAPSTSGNVLTSNGTTWQSTAPTSSAPTTAQVLSATAGASVGAVGTYALLGNASGAASIVAGTTYAGSGLAYAGFAKGNAGFASASVEQNYSAGAGSTVSGTWRAMGSNTAGFGCGTSARAATLFLRTV